MKILIAFLCCFLYAGVACARPGYGSNISDGAKNFRYSWDSLITFSPNLPAYADCFTGALDSSYPCRMDNGYPDGHIYNSGILSTNVPQGGAINIDLRELEKPWLKAFSVGWNGIFWQMLPAVFWLLGLVIGYQFIFWIQRCWSLTKNDT